MFGLVHKGETGDLKTLGRIRVLLLIRLRTHRTAALAITMHKPSMGYRNREAPQKINAVKTKCIMPKCMIHPG